VRDRFISCEEYDFSEVLRSTLAEEAESLYRRECEERALIDSIIAECMDERETDIIDCLTDDEEFDEDDFLVGSNDW